MPLLTPDDLKDSEPLDLEGSGSSSLPRNHLDSLPAGPTLELSCPTPPLADPTRLSPTLEAPLWTPPLESLVDEAVYPPLLDRFEDCDSEWVDSIQLSSSIGPKTSEVHQMAKAHAQGTALALYEFMQGQVDYGASNPPPRLVIVFEDGSRTLFTGADSFLESGKRIQALDFYNYGPSFNPTNLVKFQHDGEGETLLGRHGRGTTVACTFLNSVNMLVDVYSHYEGRGWRGRTFLKSLPGDKEGDQVLHVNVDYLSEVPFEGTIFRIQQPDETTLKTLAAASNLFLYANPRYPRAKLVPVQNREEAAAALEAKTVLVEQGRVMCLDKIFEESIQSKSSPYDYRVFVDGLNVHMGYPTLLPWGIEALSETKEKSLRVDRSSDSTRADGHPEIAIAWAVRHLEDRNTLEKLLLKGMDACSKNSHVSYAEFLSPHFFSHFSLHLDEISQATALLMKSLWEQHFGAAVISDSTSRVERYRKTHSTPQVFYMGSGLYWFLRACGVPDLENVSPEKSSRQLDGLPSMYISFLKQENALQELLRRLVQTGGILEQVDIEGRPYLAIRFPRILKESRDFNGGSDDVSGWALRMGAIAAHELGIEYAIFSRESEANHQILVKVESAFYSENTFSTELDFVSYPPDHFPCFPSYWAEQPTGCTYLLLSSENMTTGQAPDYLDDLLQQFRGDHSELEAHLSRIPAFRIHRPSRRSSFGPSTISTASMVGQVPADSWHPLDDIAGHEESLLSPGRHLSGVGRQLTLTGGLLCWTDTPSWEAISISPGHPERYSSRCVVNDFCGEQALMVPPGHAIVGFETSQEDLNDSVQFFRDPSTGIYKLSGEARSLVYYTDSESKSSLTPPRPEDREDVLDYEILDETWKPFIKELRGAPLSSIKKAHRIQEELVRRFSYRADLDLNDALTGNTVGEAASRLLNACSGMCSVVSTAKILLLRAVGIPAYECHGYLVDDEGTGGSHSFLRYWDGYRWIVDEPQIGMMIASYLSRKTSVNVRPPEADYAVRDADVNRLVIPPLLRAQNHLRRRWLIALGGAGLLAACGWGLPQLRSSDSSDSSTPSSESTPADCMKACEDSPVDKRR